VRLFKLPALALVLLVGWLAARNHARDAKDDLIKQGWKKLEGTHPQLTRIKMPCASFHLRLWCPGSCAMESVMPSSGGPRMPSTSRSVMPGSISSEGSEGQVAAKS
jgi:hypothetical protein